MNGPRLLVVDNFDSFTFTLVDYLRTAGADVSIERNDVVSVGDALAGPFEGFVISPGPGAPQDAGISVGLARACIDERRPLLGVCLGHQAIALAGGGAVSKVPPVHGKVSAMTHDGSGVFNALPSPLSATRYHSLAVKSPGTYLAANAHSDDGIIMGVRHGGAPVHGVQFHPESVASEHGHSLIGNFVALAGMWALDRTASVA